MPGGVRHLFQRAVTDASGRCSSGGSAVAAFGVMGLLLVRHVPLRGGKAPAEPKPGTAAVPEPASA